MHPKNIEITLKICQEFKKQYPNKTIWCWSGFKFEDIQDVSTCIDNMPTEFKDFVQMVTAFHNTLGLIDVLVDGKFIEEYKDLTLKWRGSSNQRVIDVPRSLEKGRVVLYAE